MYKLSFRYAILSIITHSLFIALTSIPGWRAEPLANGDSVTYLMDAENILLRGFFSRELASPYLWEPYRTPGYPLLLAFSKLITGNVVLSLYVAALAAGLAAWTAVQLSVFFGCDKTGQHVTGWICAFLPNSLGLSAFLLTDAIFGYLFLFWVYLLCWGFSTSNKLVLLSSVLVLFALQSFKPTLNLGFLFIFTAAVLFARNQKPWIFASLLAGFALFLPFVFSLLNYRDNGVFSPSLLGIQTAREYLQVRYLAEQTDQEMDQVTKQVRLQDYNSAKLLSEPESLYGRIYLINQTEVDRFILGHPIAILRLMGSEMIMQFAAPQEFAWLVFDDPPPFWVRVIGSLLTILLWVGAGLGTWAMVKRGNYHFASFLIAVLAFFLVTGSISHFVGARLRFPADLLAAPFFSYGINVITHIPHLTNRPSNNFE